jgi:hypothetical protein
LSYILEWIKIAGRQKKIDERPVQFSNLLDASDIAGQIDRGMEMTDSGLVGT